MIDHLVVVSDEAIYPTNSGGRLLALYETVAIRPHVRRLDLIIFHRDDLTTLDREQHESLADNVMYIRRPPLLRSLTRHPLSAYHFSSRPGGSARKRYTEDRPDVVVARAEWTVPAAYELTGPNTKLILRSQNDEAVFLRDFARASRFPRRAYLAREALLASRKRLGKVASLADEVWTVSPHDERAYSGMACTTIPPVLLLEAPSGEISTAPDAHVIAYVGALDIAHNVEGLLWYCDHVLPLVRSAHPRAELHVAGRRCAPALRRRLEGVPGLQFLGEVPSSEAVILRARVALNPALSGSGINMKCGEPARLGRPIITTVHGARGLESLFDGSAPPSNDPRALAASSVTLLADDAAWLAESARIRQAVRPYTADKVASFMVERIAQTTRTKGIR